MPQFPKRANPCATKKSKSSKSASEKNSADEFTESADNSDRQDLLIAGIGASAGGIQALKEFFENVPADSGLLDLRIEDITHPDDYPRNHALLEKLYADGEPFMIEKRYVGKNGETILVCSNVAVITDSGERPLSTLIVSIDITERKKIEEKLSAGIEQLSRQTRVFDTTLSFIADFAYAFDREGRFIYANKPLLDLLGITLAEITGKNFHELPYSKDLADKLQAHIERVFETKNIVRDETPFVNPAGAEGFYEYIFSPVFGENGAVEVVAGSTRDITERKRSELNFEFLAEVSQELARLSGIDEVMQAASAKIGAFLNLSNCTLMEVSETADTAVVTHEWRQPDAPSLFGKYRIGEFVTGEFQRACRAGETFVVRDTQKDARTDAVFAPFAPSARAAIISTRQSRAKFSAATPDSKPNGAAKFAARG